MNINIIRGAVWGNKIWSNEVWSGDARTMSGRSLQEEPLSTVESISAYIILPMLIALTFIILIKIAWNNQE